MKLFDMCKTFFQEFFLQNQIQELYKYEKLLNSFTLQFRSEELEISYQNRQMAKVVVQFRISIILQILINIGFIINSGIVYKSISIVQYRSIFIGWMVLCLYVQKKSKKYWNFITNLLVFVNSVVNVLLFAFFTKFVNPSQANVNDVVSLSLMSGLQQGLFAMSYFLIQSNYLMQCSTMISFFLIMMGIFTQFLNYRLWTQYLLLLFTCYLLRSKEKTNRLNFLLIHKSIQNLEACKKLYDETVPTSIIILEENVMLDSNRNELLNSVMSNEGLCSQESRSVNVVYFNKSASFHFETINESILTSKLSEIEIINSDTSNKVQSEKLLDKIQGLQLNLQTEMKFTNFQSFDYQIMSINQKMQCQRTTKTQTVQYYDAQAQGCLWDGKQSIMLILNDTTDRVLRIKHLQELDNYKDNLLATVSHDLKTPLNGLSIIANVVKNSIENKEKIKKNEILEIIRHMDDMLSNQQILLTMINDLIDFIQQKKKGLRLNITHFDLNNCVEQVIQMFRRQMEMKKIVFKVDGLSEKITMFSDQIRLQQILFNLISNAIKFTFEGTITLIITILEQNNNTLVQFTVQDTGLGIPLHIQNKLFKAYSTYNLGNCNQQGVGLGLVISRSLVGLLGPQEYIEMTSKEREGSSFSFTIFSNAHYKDNQHNIETHCPENDPCSINQLPSIQVQQSSRKSRRCQTSFDSLTSRKKPLQVLIVDDTIFNIYALKQLLEKLLIKKEIEEAYNGLDALKKVKQKRYDIIFMDVSMPVMDGLQAIQEIRKYQEKEKISKSTICVLSAFEEKEDASKSLSVGADIYLDKPLKVQILKSMLEQYQFI